MRDVVLTATGVFPNVQTKLVFFCWLLVRMLGYAAGAAASWGAWKLWERRNMGAVRGTRAVVTGGASGLGLALARTLLRRGAAALVLLDLEEKALERAQEQLLLLATQLRLSVVVRTYVCNVADPAAVKVRETVVPCPCDLTHCPGRSCQDRGGSRRNRLAHQQCRNRVRKAVSAADRRPN